MTAVRPRRSVLYVPGSNARALEKARGLGADVLIVDLEDSVAPDIKDDARAYVRDVVRVGGFGRSEILIRVNGMATPWGEADLEAAIAAGPDGILIPKVYGPSDLTGPTQMLGHADPKGTIALWAMIETPMAILNLREIAALAAASPARLAGFVMGTNDLAKDTGARLNAGRAAMLPWLMMTLAAARAHELAVIDGVYNDLDDLSGFKDECAAARDMGFDGKTLIHPLQIEGANRIFSPSAAEVTWARRIVAAFAEPENTGKGVLRIDGRMVERLHADMATRTLAMMVAIGEEALEPAE
jgi:citrate lyase subunit beta/citryl-CoA lyase